MRTLYITLIILILMVFIIPFHSLLAVSPTSPLYSHFVYMFGHANLMHWAINAGACSWYTACSVSIASWHHGSAP